jgi:hypothetical protein
MKKGLFWVVGDNDERFLLTFAAECDKNGQRIGDTPAFNSKKGDNFSHQSSWLDAAKNQPGRVKNKPWDYYPRGRVEITNGTATVYFNPILQYWKGFSTSVVLLFGISDLPIVMTPDYSVHYKHKQEQAL